MVKGYMHMYCFIITEITREDSHDASVKKDSGSKTFIKSDSVESSKSSKQTPEQSADRDAGKYSARMDSRDGYRDSNYGNSNSTSPREHNRDSGENIHRHSGDSKTPQGASNYNSNSKHAKSMSPGSRASPRARESPRTRESPRSQSSPKHGGPRDPSPREGKPVASQRQSKGRNSAKSPVPSPKSNAKSHDYPEVEPLELSKVSSIDKEQDDVNYVESDDDSITGEINPPVDDNRVRLFVALFDYDPESMSPNVDSLDEELPFREGNIIKVCSFFT